MPEPLPAGAYEAADEAFEAFRVGDDGPRDELEAALQAAAKVIRADERERVRKIALDHGAVYCQRRPCTCIRLGSDPAIRSFADLIRGPS